jgi:hypothetical protein
MPDHRLARCLLCAAVFLAPGCRQAFYSYRPVSAQVRDAETKKPLAGAEVHISYPMTRPSVAPWDSVETTGDDGIAHLRAAPSGEAGLRVAAAAEGYLPESINVPIQAVEEIPPAPFLLPDKPRPATYVFDLYAGPPPSVELILPKDFRGLVKAVIQVHDDEPCPVGKRRFTYNVNPDGGVLVSGPSLLHRVFTPDYHARYAGGPELSKDGRDMFEVRFRPLKAGIDVQYFAVGNQSEFDALRRLAEKMDKEEARPAKKNPDANQPRRHRRNSQTEPSS